MTMIIVHGAVAMLSSKTQIVYSLARGVPAADTAAELCLSMHTVRDHIKAIFGEVEVTSRGELVATLFFELEPRQSGRSDTSMIMPAAGERRLPQVTSSGLTSGTPQGSTVE
jgi:DNA-binding CsgD family transcriptional regulator